MGICHQVNLEFLSNGVIERNGDCPASNPSARTPTNEKNGKKILSFIFKIFI